MRMLQRRYRRAFLKAARCCDTEAGMCSHRITYLTRLRKGVAVGRQFSVKEPVSGTRTGQ